MLLCFFFSLFAVWFYQLHQLLSKKLEKKSIFKMYWKFLKKDIEKAQEKIERNGPLTGKHRTWVFFSCRKPQRLDRNKTISLNRKHKLISRDWSEIFYKSRPFSVHNSKRMLPNMIYLQLSLHSLRTQVSQSVWKFRGILRQVTIKRDWNWNPKSV